MARAAYLRRYSDFFSSCLLKGKRLLVYQHAAVGRDLLVEILQRLGAEAIPAGRSETFVPIDTAQPFSAASSSEGVKPPLSV